MPIVVSSKRGDFGAWRTAGDFGTSFREQLLKSTATLTSEQAEALFRGVGEVLERRAAENDACLARLRHLIAEAGAAGAPALLKGVLQEFYGASYDFFGQNRSAPALFRLSGDFLRAVGGAVVAGAMEKLGPAAGKLPPVAVIVLGPAGRHEFTPFCRLPLLLVHGVADPSLAVPMDLLGAALHEQFEAAGLLPDEVITPRNPAWRGDLEQWRQRFAAGLERGTPAEMINLLRVADQAALFPNEGLEHEFCNLCMSQLHNSRASMAFLVTRVMGLSKGLGMMGGLRLKKFGPYRGMFALFDHALLPLTASVTALSLIHGVNAAGTRQRILELLSRQELNVEMAEHLLQAWFCLQELRLARERGLFPALNENDSLYIDVEGMADAETEQLRDTLETVATLQRHVTVSFSGWEEQAAC